MLATGGAALTTAGAATNGTPLANVTAAALGIAPGTPVLSRSGLVTGIGLDTGYAIGGTTAVSLPRIPQPAKNTATPQTLSA